MRDPIPEPLDVVALAREGHPSRDFRDNSGNWFSLTERVEAAAANANAKGEP